MIIITSCFDDDDPGVWTSLIGDFESKVYAFDTSIPSSFVKSIVAQLLIITLFKEFMGTAGGTAFLSTIGDNVRTLDVDGTC